MGSGDRKKRCSRKINGNGKLTGCVVRGQDQVSGLGCGLGRVGLQVQKEELSFVPVESEQSGNYPRRVGRKVWLFVVTKM